MYTDLNNMVLSCCSKVLFYCNNQVTYIYYYVAGLVVPDVPLEETDILRSEAAKNNLELVGPLS